MQEDFRRSVPLKIPSDRTFGYVIVGIFVVVALLPLLHRPWEPPRIWALAVAILFAFAAALRPASLRPFNRLWARFGLLLHRIMSTVVLAVIFYGVILPIGLAMRLLGKDPLKLRPSPAVQSYWIERPPGPSPQSMQQQF